MDDSTRDLLMSGIRSIPDYPIPGVLYRDITPLLADGERFHRAIDAMAAPFTDVSQVVVIESRGFALGAPIAFDLGVGLTLVRKAGRLPFETISESYSLEYGTPAWVSISIRMNAATTSSSSTMRFTVTCCDSRW